MYLALAMPIDFFAKNRHFEGDIACEKFLSVINEGICDLTEVGDEWFGYDSTLDRIIRDNYYEDAYED